MGSLRLQQLGAVLKKAYLLRMKTPITTIFEFIFPSLVLGFLVLKRTDFTDPEMMMKMFSMALFLSLAMTLSKLTHLLVTEREQRIAEMMKILGLPSWIHYLGWFIGYMIVMLLMSALMAPIIVFGELLPSTNFLLFFTLLMTFSASSISFSMLLSVPFDSAKAAQSFMFLVYYLTQFSNYFIEDWSDSSIKLFMFLFPTLTFSEVLNTMAELSSTTGGANWNTLDDHLPYSIGNGLLLMALSAIVYLILYIYLDQVYPHAVGTRRHPLFFLESLKNMFKKESGDRRAESTSLMGDEDKTVRISGLSKSYEKSKPALSDLNLELRAGELTVLLGRNGAGKTTLINILTGMTEASSGSAKIFHYSVGSEMDAIRTSNAMGLCPQHDILWPQLTVNEHFDIFGKIRGLSSELIRERSLKLIASLGLIGKEKEKVSALSGGMKRKLSVALSFLGDSKFVILDEPTSGLDPLSRRHMWEILGKLREDRVMLLSTHYMDEAEVLGERVVILSEGVLKANGTVNELKLQHNCGYELRFYGGSGVKKIDAGRLGKVVGEEAKISMLANGLVAQVTIPIDFGPKLEQLLSEVRAEFSPAEMDAKVDIVSKRLEEVFMKVSMDDGNLEQLVIPVSEDDEALSSEEEDMEAQMAIGGKLKTVKAEKIEYASAGFQLFRSQVEGTIIKKLKMILREKRTALLEYGFPLVMLGMGVWVRKISMDSGGRQSGSMDAPTNADDVERASKDFPQGNMILVMFVLIALTSVSSNILAGLNREHASQSKFLQLVAGLTPTAYWTGSLVMDLAQFYCVPFATTGIMLAAASMSLEVGPIMALLTVYGPAILAQTYFVSVSIRSVAFAKFASTILNTVLGFLLPLVFLAIWISDPKQTWVPTVITVLQIFPSFNLGYGIWVYLLHSSFSANRSFAATMFSPERLALLPKFLRAKHWFDFSLLGGPIMFMLGGFVILFVATIVVDDMVYTHKFASAIGLTKDDLELAASNAAQAAVLGVVDDSVGKERVRAKDASGKYVLRVNDVSKKYKKGGRPAVLKVPLAVAQNGEILTILGENGAGKTTLVKMVIGEIIPSEGSVFVGELDSKKNLKEFRQLIGYCPQFDALAMQLTVKDHLRLYARIKGVKKESMDVAVKQIVDWLGLTQFVNRKARALSGGYRRRLSLAIALMGNPSIVFLDEPSCGMDPIARRQMWTVMQSASRKAAVVLTTHSMEEAESVSTRLGMMSKGRMVCLGTASELREKFSNGLEVFIQTSAPQAALVDSLVAQFSQSTAPFVAMAASHSEKRRLRFLTSGMSLIGKVVTTGSPDPALIPTFADWWAQEDIIDAIEIAVTQGLRLVTAFEASGRSVRFVVAPESKVVDFDLVKSVFGSLSGLKANKFIVDYSLTLNSLDQVFRSIASKELEAEALEAHSI